MLLLGAGLNIGRRFYLNAVTSPNLSRDTAGAVYDVLVRFLRGGIRMVLIAVLVTALVAYLTGPSKAATTVRGTLTKAGSKAPIGSGKAAAFAAAHRLPLLVAGPAFAGLVLLWVDTPTVSLVLLLALIALATMAVVFVLAASAANAPAPVDGPTADGGITTPTS